MNKEQISKEIQDCENRLAELRKKMAEPEKPKIRHGDCGFKENKDWPYIALKDSIARSNGLISAGNGCIFEGMHLTDVYGNLFDDLKLYGEDCEKYEGQDGERDKTIVSIAAGGDRIMLERHHRTRGVDVQSIFELDEAIAFANKIKQIAYTAKRRAK
jgi:hypothetical protein